MATGATKMRCIKCGKEKATIRCSGCLEELCFKHWESHRQELNQELDEIELNRDVFRQSLIQYTEQPDNHALIQEIDRWKQESIKVIEQTAEEARKAVFQMTSKNIAEIERKLNELTNQLRQSREENDFNEINLSQFQEELHRLSEELARPSNLSLEKSSSSFISQIFVRASGSKTQLTIQPITKWIQHGMVVAGGNGNGENLNQLCFPAGLCIDDDQNIYIADYGNHRIVKWKHGANIGQIVAGGNGQGNRMNQLNCPTDIVIDKEKKFFLVSDRSNRRVVRWPLQNGNSGETIISDIDCNSLQLDNDGYLYVSDWKKDEVRRWKIGDTMGVLVAGGNGKGDCLNQLNHPTYIFIDKDQSVYVSDMKNKRVMKWTKGAQQGIIVAGSQNKEKMLVQLTAPVGLIVRDSKMIYVVDRNNPCVMRWYEGEIEGTVIIGGDEETVQTNQLRCAEGLSFDQQENLYVVDYGNHQVLRFDINRS